MELVTVKQHSNWLQSTTASWVLQDIVRNLQGSNLYQPFRGSLEQYLEQWWQQHAFDSEVDAFEADKNRLDSLTLDLPKDKEALNKNNGLS